MESAHNWQKRVLREQRRRFFQHRFVRLVKLHAVRHARRLIDHRRPELRDHFRHELLRVFSFGEHVRSRRKRFLRVFRRQRPQNPYHAVPPDQSQNIPHERFRDFFLRQRNALIERGQCVTKAAVGFPRHQGQRRVVRRNPGRLHDLAQTRLDVLRRDSLEIVSLATGLDRRRNLLELRRRENEHHVWRRLLQRLQERIERLAGQHVHFVDDIDFVPPHGRSEFHRLPEFADFVNAAV